MPANIEIKARVSDPETLLAKARALTGSEPEIILQTDTFFQAETGRLKVREFADGSGELISYHRPDFEGPKTSSYAISRTADANALRNVLAAALPARGVVRKKRLLLLAGRTRIHLDEVEGLGFFMELEVVLADEEDQDDGEMEAAKLMERLGVTSDNLVSGAYIDLLESQQQNH
ncbi:MAG: class IV adenylate cyclase [Candidatus Krumholzibacteria bacterium]|nr:class IV adenylate cyclase [Candidatus Krumholzibacteria bacterium]